MRILESISQAVGQTPLVRLSSRTNTGRADVVVKLEFYSPASSVKDRIGLAIIEAAERSGQLKPGGLIVEGTSGNTGIALAWVAAARGYRLVLAMPDSMSVERRALLRAYGAELVLTPRAEGMRGAVAKAEQIASQRGGVLANQFANQANPATHYATPGPEIWQATEGRVDAMVFPVGTGGTLSGAGRYLKQRKPELKIVAVEPTESPLLSQGSAGPHGIQGIGANFVPETLDRSLIDQVVTVDLGQAVATARQLATNEGILGGISAGAAVRAALDWSARPESEGQLIVTVVPDFGERYLSTPLFEGLVD
jgi:cysteine synthase A